MNVTGKKNILLENECVEKFNQTFPPVFYKLHKLLENENTTLTEIAEVIKKDVILTTKLLRIANTPYYGFPKKVATVEDALMLMGLNMLRIIIYTLCITDIMNSHYQSLCKHSVSVGSIARLIAITLGLEKTGEVYTAGLLHDFGKIIIKICQGCNYEKLIKKSKEEGKPLWLVEQETFKVNHARLAELLLIKWKFPDRLIEAISCHHFPEKSRTYKKEAAVIHLADAIANAYPKRKYNLVPGFNPDSLKILEIDENTFNNEILPLCDSL